MKIYRYQVEPNNGAFTVTRLCKIGNKFIPDAHAKPVKVTNHEFMIVDLPSIFESVSIDIDKLRESGL